MGFPAAGSADEHGVTLMLEEGASSEIADQRFAYKAISLQIREIFAEYTPIIEPLSLDEAYLDVTENLKGIASATQIAEEIRAKVRAHRVQLARMPLDLGHNPSRLVPALRLMAEAGVVPTHLVRRSPDRALEKVSDPRQASELTTRCCRRSTHAVGGQVRQEWLLLGS